MRASLLARDPVIAEKHHGNEKAYLDKVVSGHSRTPVALSNHGGLTIVGRKTSKIEQPLSKPTSGGAQTAKPNVRFWGYSGHCDFRASCLLLTQSGHRLP
jgi:hypothetical protein